MRRAWWVRLQKSQDWLGVRRCLSIEQQPFDIVQHQSVVELGESDHKITTVGSHWGAFHSLVPAPAHAHSHRNPIKSLTIFLSVCVFQTQFLPPSLLDSPWERLHLDSSLWADGCFRQSDWWCWRCCYSPASVRHPGSWAQICLRRKTVYNAMI